jgi:murein L,D-transpeptidase YcbB/YkuD
MARRQIFDRRTFLRHLAAGAAALTGTEGARAQSVSDTTLDQLIDQTQRGEYGQGFDSASRTILMPKASWPTLSPATVRLTEQAIQRYNGIVARGGWPSVPKVDRLRVGNRHPSVSALRHRLAVVGDLSAKAGITDIFDSYVEAALRRFQARHGLLVDGILRESTLQALNVSAPVRLSQLKTNLVRLRAMSRGLGHRFVVCNIPAAQVEAIEGGVALSRHVAVVGKPDRPSPDIQSRIIEINFNPYWTVPASIVRLDLIPKMQTEPGYLAKNRIRIFDARGGELAPARINWYSEEAANYQFKQDPGQLNSLGSVRINFPSRDGVYMHDTPFKNLFGEDFRFHSSGCIRVQNVRELVSWLLIETPGWSRQQVDNIIRSGERRDARIARPVPVYWVYVTAWAAPDGVVQFREDIYARDGIGPASTATRG